MGCFVGVASDKLKIHVGHLQSFAINQIVALTNDFVEDASANARQSADRVMACIVLVGLSDVLVVLLEVSLDNRDILFISEQSLAPSMRPVELETLIQDLLPVGLVR